MASSLAYMGRPEHADSRTSLVLTGLSALPVFFLLSVLLVGVISGHSEDAQGAVFMLIASWLFIGLPFGSAAGATLYVWDRRTRQGRARTPGERRVVNIAQAVLVLAVAGPFVLLFLGSAFNPWR
jgi:hypothetical protein